MNLAWSIWTGSFCFVEQCVESLWADNAIDQVEFTLLLKRSHCGFCFGPKLSIGVQGGLCARAIEHVLKLINVLPGAT